MSPIVTQPLHQHNPELAAIVAASDDAIVSLGTDFVVKTWNAGAQRMFGYDEVEARGQLLNDLIVPGAEGSDIYSAAVECRTIASREMVGRHKDGHPVAVKTSASPILDGFGTVTGLSVILRDIRERQYAELTQARLAAIVMSSADAIIGKTLDGFITTWNQAAERMFSYPASEMIGQSVRRLIPADRQRDEDVILTRLARSECIEQYETVLLAKDGRTFDASITVSPMRDACGGIIGCSKIIRDITARKRDEAHLELLMRELNHRAKNMLSLVQAIARQTATRAPEDFIDTFTERIRALAANQDLLIRNEWQGVFVEDLVRAQLAHFADLVGSRIAVHGPRLRLNAAAAQAVGLALHELATNAGKYGALSTETGGVEVDWRLDAGVFTMGWTERNGPPVKPPGRQGFGNMVLDLMAKRTVDGDVALEYAPSGLAWRLTCVAANALERS
jgi:PAS domain S-box-containing protein